MSRCLLGPLGGLLLLASFSCSSALAQPAAKEEETQLPNIADEPKTIDPAASMPPELTVPATHDFSDSSLREVVAWLQDQQELVVLLDHGALAAIGVSPAEPISDRLDNAPLYMLLNRLRSLGLAWYFEDKILHITTTEVAEERAVTLPYNVGDLLDAGHDLDSLEAAITETIAPDCWDVVGGIGAINSLGDVLFIRQTDAVQREVQGLLAALRGHARRTYVNDPPQHQALRAKLAENVSVEFSDTPLVAAVEQLAEAAKADIRLDLPALRRMRLREREPVTLTLTDRKLETVIQALVLDLQLTWILRDGVLWITSVEEAEQSLKTAVYDVRDLCSNEKEVQPLLEALTSQTQPDSWSDVGGPGSIDLVNTGTLVIRHQERVHQEVLQLLETYRQALRASKPRQRDAEFEREVVTTYYRMHADVARDLATMLPVLVHSESWRSEARPEATGELHLVASAPQITQRATRGEEAEGEETVVLPQAVLIIRQTRAVHNEIAEVVRRVESGDVVQFGEGLGGMGGFGGGFFSVPPRSGPERLK
ncbi:MAG: hypothetical protein RIC55_13235 [Pirellulaceae bacterium]